MRVLIMGLRTVSEINAHEHYRGRVQRVRAQHESVLHHLRAASSSPPPLPVVVTLTRLSSGRLDSFDNLPASLKHVADAVAWWLRGCQGEIGQADRDEQAIRFRAEQSQTKRGVYGVQIEIAPLVAEQKAAG